MGRHVPICASAAPLVFVGCLMMGPVGEIDWNDLNHALPSFLCILMMPFTGSVTWGIAFGLEAYGLMALSSPCELFRNCSWAARDLQHQISPPPSPSPEGYATLPPDGALVEKPNNHG